MLHSGEGCTPPGQEVLWICRSYSIYRRLSAPVPQDPCRDKPARWSGSPRTDNPLDVQIPGISVKFPKIIPPFALMIPDYSGNKAKKKGIGG